MSANIMQNSELLPKIRAEVRDRLMQNPSFAALPEEERRSLAQNTVTALTYILGGEKGDSQPDAVALADRPALPQNPAQHTKSDFKELTAKGDSGDNALKQFKDAGGAVATNAGTDALGNNVSRVDFPAFVGGLIKGVFDAINNSTMAQLKAYSELVKNVAKSVGEFMKDNVSEGAGKDYLLQRYPNALQADLSGNQPKLLPKEDAEDSDIQAMFKDLGLPVESAPDEETVDEKLVPAARRRIALDRQQLLATMVMMGVNRLVVTNGTIDASVLFELKTKDEIRSRYGNRGSYGGSQYASNYDNRTTITDSSSGGGFFGALFGGDESNTHDEWYRGHWDSDSAQFSVTTSRNEDSASKVELHTKLTGKVNVNFKSDYFPMERMTDVLQMNLIKEKAMGEQAVQIAKINADREAAKYGPVNTTTPATTPVPTPAANPARA